MPLRPARHAACLLLLSCVASLLRPCKEGCFGRTHVEQGKAEETELRATASARLLWRQSLSSAPSAVSCQSGWPSVIFFSTIFLSLASLALLASICFAP